MQVTQIQPGKAISVEVECYGTVPTNPGYSVKRDGSLSMGGIEVVFTGERSDDQPFTMPELDVVAGCTVDRTCGLHVHIDLRDETSRFTAANVYRSLTRFHSVLKMLVPDSRLNNRYCMWRSNALTNSRYCAINFKAYYKFRTIEFRCQSGSTDRVKIEKWAELCYQLVQWAKANPFDGNPSQMKWNAFLQILTPEIRNWAIMRRTKLRHRDLVSTVTAVLGGQETTDRQVLELVGRQPVRTRRAARVTASGRTSSHWWGYSVCSVLRAMGAIGIQEPTAIAAARRDGIQVQDSTIRFMLRMGERGEGRQAPILAQVLRERVLGQSAVTA